MKKRELHKLLYCLMSYFKDKCYSEVFKEQKVMLLFCIFS